MKKKELLLSVAIVPLVVVLFLALFYGKNERSYTPRSFGAAQEIAGAADFWKTIRANQITGVVADSDVLKAMKEMANMKPSKSLLAWEWDEMGPDNLGGRTRSILFDKDDPNIMYAGSVSGGLWKSTTAGSSWSKVTSISDNMVIGSITQAPNGDIYVGTGEGFYPGTGTGVRGFNGKGIYKSTDGTNFTHLAATLSWLFVNEMAVASNGTIYAATSGGLKASSDEGATWTVPINVTPTGNTNAQDVEVASDGTVVAVINKNCFISTNGVDFTRISGTPGSMPVAGSRMEIAIAPSDPNYIYAVLAAADGKTQGIWRTTDKGSNWTQIAPAATTSFNILGNQGDFDNTIAVFPNNKNKIIVGGINLWVWEEGKTWLQITSGSFPETSGLYVHVDMHEIKFHPKNDNIIFVGCDGGIHRSIDQGATWASMNKNYNTIQYYAITSSGSGQVIGGTQDNSNQFIDFKGNSERAARTIWSGDGGYTAFSQINPEAYFVTSQFGHAARTANDFKTYQKAYKGTNAQDPEFFSKRMLLEGKPGESFSSFVTPMAIWETDKAIDSKDSVLFIADTSFLAGEEIVVKATKHNNYPFRHTLLAGLQEGDSMWIQNPIQSVFVIAARTAIWMTRDALDFSITPQWYKIGTITGGMIQTITWSNDGDHLFVGSTTGNVFRFSNIRQAYDSLSADVTSNAQVISRTLISSWSGRAVTSISVNPNDHDLVVVTLGNYGNNAYVYYSTDALSANPNFTSKQGTAASTKLPSFPVYSSVFPMNKPKMVIVGTEYGTYICEDITANQPTWVEANNGMDRVPTLMLHQQTTAFPYTYYTIKDGKETLLVEYPQTTNYGGIYAATHGRGAFRNLSFVGIEKPKVEKPSSFKSNVLVYPNPVANSATAIINVATGGNGVVRIYDLTGKVVKSFNYTFMNGRNEFKLDTENLKTGNYLVQVTLNGERKTTKIIKK